MIRGCLVVALGGPPCGPGIPVEWWCDPCARRAGLADTADPVRAAYLAGYAQGWEDRTGRADYADLPGFADYLESTEPAG